MRELDVVDLILIDHVVFKECIEVLTDEEAESSKKLESAKRFFEVLKPHSEAEKYAVYATLETNEEFRSHILEGEIEHGIVDEKVQLLEPKVMSATELDDNLEAELKVVADLVKHHMQEEESELLPKIRSELDDLELEVLTLMYADFRQISRDEILDRPDLSRELKAWMKSDEDEAKKQSTRLKSAIKELSA